MENEDHNKIEIFKKQLSVDDVRRIAVKTFDDMAKAVIDVEQNIIALGGELHADAEALLIQQGSKQSNLWGINLYPNKNLNEWIEFTSLINIRPSIGNRSQEIQDPVIREKIRTLITTMLEASQHDN